MQIYHIKKEQSAYASSSLCGLNVVSIPAIIRSCKTGKVIRTIPDAKSMFESKSGKRTNLSKPFATIEREKYTKFSKTFKICKRCIKSYNRELK